MMGQRKIPIQLVNSAQALINQTGKATFSDLPYGAPASGVRLCIVCITGEENTIGTVDITAVTWGGVSLTLAESARVGIGSSGSVACYAGIFAGYVASGARGDLVCTIDKSTSSTENIDSIAVSTLVTNLAPSAVKVDNADQGGFNDATITAPNLETVAGGFMIACAAASDHTETFSSINGNGSNGNMAELVDENIADDHRHGVYLLTPTVAQTTEDFTSTMSGAPVVHALATASWAGGNL